MIFVLLLCLMIGAGVLLAYRLNKREKRGHPLPPLLPFRLPIIGHTHLLAGDSKDAWELVKFVSLQTNQLGGVSVAYIGLDTYYFITDPEEVLTAANACLQKHFVYDFSKNWLGNGLITGSGEIYKRHRKLMTPALSLPVVQTFLEVFNSQARKLVKQLEPHCGNGPMNIYKPLRHLSSESFCLTSFGVDGYDKDFADKYMKASDYMLMLITSRFFRVYLQSETIYKLSGLYKTEMETIKVLKNMSKEVIKKKKAALNNEMNTGNGNETKNKRYKPLLELLLTMEDRLTDEEISEEIDSAISAGFDTTALTSLYTLILLGSHPEVQQKVYEEIMEVIGPDRDVEKDDISKLVYIDAMFKESLRLIPGGPVLPRYALSDVKLKKYTIPAGSQVVLLPFGTHHHSVWGSDSDKFRPERWLDANTLPDIPSAFGGFSWGKRSCVGKAYALTTMKVNFAHLLRRYRVKSDVSQLKFKYGFILKPDSGYDVCLEERN